MVHLQWISMIQWSDSHTLSKGNHGWFDYRKRCSSIKQGFDSVTKAYRQKTFVKDKGSLKENC